MQLITVHDANGRTAKIAPESAEVWAARGWSQHPAVPDAEASQPAATDLNLSPALQPAVASEQPSDVTAPGESEIEGVAPSAHAQDEE